MTNLPATRTTTAIEAYLNLTTVELTSMQDLCQESHKDFYGVRGRWMYGEGMDTLLRWWTNHFRWDVTHQVWKNTEPFQGEDEVTDDYAVEVKHVWALTDPLDALYAIQDNLEKRCPWTQKRLSH